MNQSCYLGDLSTTAHEWLTAGRAVALATIVYITGSSSRPLGSRMICAADGGWAGAVSGGCVESDVARHAAEVLTAGRARVVHYGRVQDPELEIGLNCEGEIDVLIEPLDAEWLHRHDQAVAGVTVTEWNAVHGTVRRVIVRPAALESAADDQPDWFSTARAAWRDEESRAAVTAEGMVLAEPHLPPLHLVIFGAGPIAEDLCRIAKVLGYATVISDPREDRFGGMPSTADRTMVSWPAATLSALAEQGAGRTVVVSLEHEPRFEDALWRALLDRLAHGDPRPRYIGAIGKAQRAIEREQRAQTGGWDLAPLQPIHTPIGLPIGGRSTAEIALSIAGQIVATINGREDYAARPFLTGTRWR